MKAVIAKNRILVKTLFAVYAGFLLTSLALVLIGYRYYPDREYRAFSKGYGIYMVTLLVLSILAMRKLLIAYFLMVLIGFLHGAAVIIFGYIANFSIWLRSANESLALAILMLKGRIPIESGMREFSKFYVITVLPIILFFLAYLLFRYRWEHLERKPDSAHELD